MLNFAVGKTEDGNNTIDNRTMVRAIITEEYKFARYFSPLDFNTPKTMEELLEHNDIELYDMKNDPEEMNNLALDPEKNEALIMEMNEKLNQLIEAEIGVDDGSELENSIKMIEKAFELNPEFFQCMIQELMQYLPNRLLTCATCVVNIAIMQKRMN